MPVRDEVQGWVVVGSPMDRPDILGLTHPLATLPSRSNPSSFGEGPCQSVEDGDNEKRPRSGSIVSVVYKESWYGDVF